MKDTRLEDTCGKCYVCTYSRQLDMGVVLEYGSVESGNEREVFRAIERNTGDNRRWGKSRNVLVERAER